MAEDIIRDALANAEAVKPDHDALRETVGRLARLDRLEYDQIRKAEADRLGVRVGELDDAISRARKHKPKGTHPPE